MITIDDLRKYHGLVLDRGEDFLSIPPDGKLHSLISCYTITFPQNMSEDYTILPFVSSTFVISAQKEQVFHCLNGVNTRQDNAGKFANKMDFINLSG